MIESGKKPENFARDYAGVRAIVFGSTGFIGRWAARALSKAGAELYLPVRDETRSQKIFDEYAVKGEIFQLDLGDAELLKNSIREIRPAIIFNLSGYGINRAETDELAAYRINVQTVERICEAFAQNTDSSWKGQTIVHAGTAMEYGAASGNLSEDTEPRPTTVYGRSKLAGTKALSRCCEKFRLKGLTARLFAVYGPGERAERLLPTLIRAARTNENIEFTAGLHERDFTYVEDVADGLLRLGLSPAEKGEIVNLATGRLTSIRKFTETAAKILGVSAGRLRFGALPTRSEEMNHDAVTIERLRHLSGWAPETTIEEGVRKTLLFTQANLTKTASYGN